MTVAAAVTLYVRAGCHLCEESEALLRRLGCEPTLVDVDGSPELAERYGERVPVLTIDGETVAWGVIRESDVKRAFGVGRGP